MPKSNFPKFGFSWNHRIETSLKKECEILKIRKIRISSTFIETNRLMVHGILKSRTTSFEFGSKRELIPIAKLELQFPTETLETEGREGTEETEETEGIEERGEEAEVVEEVGVEEAGEEEVGVKEEIEKGLRMANRKRRYTLTK